MIKLYLIRHGETDWNTTKRFQGWSDIELNKNGLKQAKLLGERFKKIKIDEIYSSPLKRAVKTAEPIAKANGIEVKTNENFKEINFGKWEGMTRDEISEIYGSEFDDFIKAPETHTFPGEISFDNVTKRLVKGLNEVLRGKNNMSIAIVSHGGIIRLMMKYLLDIREPWYNKTWVDNTSITYIEIGKNHNLLRVFNDSSHIENGIL
ncbi:MAG: histidine phosphatase family protein [Clostridia bacterium]|jgi:broad specificity phosphatase PhoE|nr:histidine phosphatase family protein [Clostridia bacterium]